MCIAIYKPSKIQLSKKTLMMCFENNPDGAGYMFSHRGDLVVKKGYFNFKDFWDDYNFDIGNDARKSDVVIHFRIMTHGKMDIKNCHPHFVNRDLAFVHNGTIGYIKKDKKISDTVVFNNDILKNLPNYFLDNSGIIELISDYIGKSKLIFMNRFGETTIINEENGVCDLGCWFSNESYKEKKVKYITYNKDKYQKNYNNISSKNTYICAECKKNITEYEKNGCTKMGLDVYLCSSCLADLLVETDKKRRKKVENAK